MNHAAAEICGDQCRLVAVSPTAGSVLGQYVFPLDESAVATVRTLRRTHALSQQLRVVLWPRSTDVGVTPITAKPGEPLPPPIALSIRERVEPLIRSGFVVTWLAQPHEALAELARAQGAGLAVVAALHAEGGCLTFAQQGRSSHRPAYLRWDAAWAQATAGSGDHLARFEFAAALASYLRQLLDAVPGGALRILACGTMANLRPAMGPLSEEFGRPVEVLDHPWPGLLEAGHESLRIDTAV
jgi:hypothetical protein